MLYKPTVSQAMRRALLLVVCCAGCSPPPPPPITDAERIRELEHKVAKREYEIGQLLERVADLEADIVKLEADPKRSSSP